MKKIIFITVLLILAVVVVLIAFNEEGPKQVKEAQREAGWILYSNNPLATLKSNPNLIDGILNDTSIIKVGDVYIMYYGGAKGDFSDTNTVRIFRVTSKDGISWERNSVPVLTPGSSGSWDSVKVETPSVLRTPDGMYKMYYVGSNIPDSEAGFQVGLATSRDGIAWEKYTGNPIIKLGSKGEFDEVSLIGPTVIYKDNEYWMWYGGISGKLGVATGLAKSKDGINWEKKGVVISLDIERESKKDVGISENFVLWNGQEFEMFYVVLLDGGKVTGPIWHATSEDGVNWTKEEGPIIDRKVAGEWTNEGLSAPSVILEDKKYRMWFTGTHTDYKSFFEGGIGLAEKEVK